MRSPSFRSFQGRPPSFMGVKLRVFHAFVLSGVQIGAMDCSFSVIYLTCYIDMAE